MNDLEKELAQCAAVAWQAQMQLGYLHNRQKPRRCTCKKDTARIAYRCDYCSPFHTMREKAEDRIAEICAERWEALGFDLEASADAFVETEHSRICALMAESDDRPDTGATS